MQVGSLYTSLVAMLLVLWTCYPIVFAMAEGTGRISSNKEVLQEQHKRCISAWYTAA